MTRVSGRARLPTSLRLLPDAAALQRDGARKPVLGERRVDAHLDSVQHVAKRVQSGPGNDLERLRARGARSLTEGHGIVFSKKSGNSSGSEFHNLAGINSVNSLDYKFVSFQVMIRLQLCFLGKKIRQFAGFQIHVIFDGKYSTKSLVSNFPHFWRKKFRQFVNL